MASTTQLPDNPHDLAERIAKATKLKGLEVIDPPSREYARIRSGGKTLCYAMLRGKRAEDSPTVTALAKADPIALHHSGRIHRYADVASAAEDVKRLAREAEQE